jgi:FkbM family methyltransferase
MSIVKKLRHTPGIKWVRSQLKQAMGGRAFLIAKGPMKGLKRYGGGWVFSQHLAGLTPEDEFLMKLHENVELSSKTVFDIGGFEGYFALYFSRLVGEEGHVVTFEPNPRNREMIERHAALNEKSNIQVMPNAIGAAAGSFPLVVDPGQPARGSINIGVGDHTKEAGDATTIDVQVARLDDLFAEHGWSPPALIKLDVEGAEADAIAGMPSILSEHRPALFIEMHGAYVDDPTGLIIGVLQPLLDLGYNIQHVETDYAITTPDDPIAKTGHLFCQPKS